MLDNVEVYIDQKDKPTLIKTGGDFFPESVREISSPYFTVTMPVKSGDSASVFIRVKTTSSRQIPVTIYTDNGLIKAAQEQNFWYGIYYGFLIVMILYNLFIYFTLRDIRYIFYSLTIFFSLGFFMILNGHAAYWIWPNSVHWNQISVHVAMGLLTACSSLFGNTFLDLKKYSPFLRKILIFNIFIGLANAMGAFFLPVIFLASFSTYIILFNIICLTVSGFIAWRRGNRYARLFVAAWSCYLLGAILLIGRNLGLLPATAVTTNFANIGSALEVVLLSLALADKVRILRQDRMEAQSKVLEMQRELNLSLENKVAMRTLQLQDEKDKSDKLLLNILPKNVADELKENGEAAAKKHEDVTVLFTDFANFTSISEMMEPESLVRDLNDCFKAFDRIIQKYHIEKIKTIGDAYLCVSGLSGDVPAHASLMVNAALEIRDFMLEFNREKELLDLPQFQTRIGIHSGPVVAGVVGTLKFAYDIWGDTVNIAARMEQTCEAGKVNISQSVYNRVKDEFTCVSRGKILAKNKGEIEMYFVE